MEARVSEAVRLVVTVAVGRGLGVDVTKRDAVRVADRVASPCRLGLPVGVPEWVVVPYAVPEAVAGGERVCVPVGDPVRVAVRLSSQPAVPVSEKAHEGLRVVPGVPLAVPVAGLLAVWLPESDTGLGMGQGWSEAQDVL